MKTFRHSRSEILRAQKKKKKMLKSSVDKYFREETWEVKYQAKIAA